MSTSGGTLEKEVRAAPTRPASTRLRRWWVVAVIVAFVVGASAAGVGVYLWQQGRISDLEAQLEQAQLLGADVAALESELQEAETDRASLANRVADLRDRLEATRDRLASTRVRLGRAVAGREEALGRGLLDGALAKGLIAEFLPGALKQRCDPSGGPMFAAHHVFGYLQAPGWADAYIWAFGQQFSWAGVPDRLDSGCGVSIPLRVHLVRAGTSWAVAGHEWPDEGEGYGDSVRAMFPAPFAEEALAAPGGGLWGLRWVPKQQAMKYYFGA